MEKFEVKKYTIFFLDSSIFFFPKGIPRMLEPKYSPYAESNDQSKTLDMPQDPTF
jgi:hypothetical protein